MNKANKNNTKVQFNPIKETVDGKRAQNIVWSTKVLEIAVKGMNDGKRLIANPFYEGNTNRLKADLVFEKTQWEVLEWLRCKDDILYFANTYCKLMTPEGIRNITLRDYQTRYLQHLMKHNMSIYLSCRQSGKTTSSAIFMLHYILFNTDKNALILGNIRDTAVEILSKVKDIYDPLPWFLKPGVVKWNEGEIVLDNKCRIIIGSTTKNAGVSFTIHCALLDEFAKIAPNIQEPFYTHVLPTITAGKARIMITSTQNGVELFCKLFTAAEAGENEYAAFKTDWPEVPEWDEEHKTWIKRDEKWKNMQIANYGGIEAFEMQFGTSFLSSSKTLISNKHIVMHKQEQIKFVPHSDITTTNGHYFLWNPDYADLDPTNNTSLYDRLRRDWFVITIDIAEGKGGDYTVFNLNRIKPRILDDVDMFETVGHFVCNEKDIQECARALYDFCQAYLNPSHYIISLEYNTYGALFTKYLTDWIDREDPANFTKDLFVRYYNEARTKSTIGVRITHKDKLKYCTLFKSDFEKEYIVNRSVVFNNELTAFVDINGNGVYKASFGHDDLVMAQIQLEAAKETIQYKNLIEDFYNSEGGDLSDVGGNESMADLYNIGRTPIVNGQSLYDYPSAQNFGQPMPPQFYRHFDNNGYSNGVGGGTLYDF